MKKFIQFFESKKKEKTLYVHRPLLNGQSIIDWYKSEIGGETLQADDMHVTIAFSKEKLDWSNLKPKKNEITIYPDEMYPEPLGDKGALVLKFKSDTLHERWQEFRDAGASWDYEGYKPHVTITYNHDNKKNINDVKPFEGKLKFGPEVFKEVDLDWDKKVEEE